MTVDRLGHEMSSKELTEWMAYLTIKDQMNKDAMNEQGHLDTARDNFR